MSLGSKILTILIATLGAGLGSHEVNYIPMALPSISNLHNGSDLLSCAALLGCNLVTNLMVAGSLATMLLIMAARRGGADVSAKDYFKPEIIATLLIRRQRARRSPDDSAFHELRER